MDWLSTAYSRALAFVQAMPPTARTTAAVSLIVVAVSAAWLGRNHLGESEAWLMGGECFSATQLRAMESAFGKAGLTDYRVEQGRIRVAQSRQAQYMAALADEEALPADFGQYLRQAVSGSGFLVYGSRQEAQTKVAIQSELQLMIGSMSGIEKASVHIAEESSRGLRPVKSVTASVGLVPRAGHAIDEATVMAVRSLVASTWGASLLPEKVTVVDLSTKRLFAGGQSQSTASPGGDYAAQKKKLELDWQEKVARVLGIPGAIVAANVQLDEAGSAPRGVSVSVAVPRAHFEEQWRRRHGTEGLLTANPDQAKLAAFERAESARIKAAVLPLVGASPGGVDRAAQVAVNTIDPPTAAQAATVEQLARQWLAQNWQPLSVGVLLVGALWMLRTSLKARPRSEPFEAPRALSLVTEEATAQPAVAPAPPARQPAAASESLRDELAGLVRHDPRVAASVIKTWMGNAS